MAAACSLLHLLRPPQRPGPRSLGRGCGAPHGHVMSQASAMSPPLRSLLLALGLGLAGTLNPNDPNTCSFWESFTTTTKESHSRPFSLLPSETCSQPWLSPHTCPKPTVVYRTVYRQVVKMDHRKRLKCCQGFYESRGACVPLCVQECVHGRCVAPNQCQCVQAWRGDDCSSDCPPGVWGPQCDKPCSCGNSSSCDPKSGACSCPSGLQPPHCLQPCSPGRYGPACQLSCNCRGAPCDPQTGACFCPPDRTGPSCEVSCVRDAVGLLCPSTSPCHNGGVFEASRGSCSCPPGWMGAICTLPCAQGFHGPSCSQECRCHNGGLCDPVTGQCSCAPGYTGERCREECPVGHFGQDCAETCDCAPGARCFPNGACLCEHGFTGHRCTERLCPEGFYGLSCQLPCTCDPEHSLSCHPMSGECSCQPGWAGLHCNESCPRDTHGPGCREHCLCLHGGLCQPDSGLCRCAPGYTGPHCASLCPPDTYGANCSSRCSCENALACSPIDGACICKEGNGVGSVVTALCPARLEPGDSVAMPAASVPMRQPAAPKPEPVPAPLGGTGSTASSPVRRGSLVKAVPIAVTVTTLRAVTLFMDSASARLAGQVSTLSDQAQAHCGVGGTRCHLPCPEGFWGANCSNTCTCKNGGTCIPENGSCVCVPGFRGPSCQRPCQPGRYGKRCVPCKCANHSSCHPSNGTCYCLAGWTGSDCSQACPPGRWGDGCAQPCQCHHGGTCHPQDGSCFCPPGWTGHLCLEGCSPGMFGANCSQPCQCGFGERCHPETGACVCPPGHSGAPCRIGSQEPFTMMPTFPVPYNSLGAVIGIAVLGSLVVALVALFIGYRRWQKGKQHQHLAVATAAGDWMALSTSCQMGSEELEEEGKSEGLILISGVRIAFLGPGLSPLGGHPAPVSVLADIPLSYSHYYSNPSYHTLSQCSPNPPPPTRSVLGRVHCGEMVPGNQLFASLQAPERPGGAHGPDNHTTLPADWKHLDRGSSHLDRSYSCSYGNSNGPGPFYGKGPISEDGLGASMASLSSENPYATIRDLPSLLGGPRESSYVEMKGPPSGSPHRQPPQLPASQRPRYPQPQPQPQRDSGTYEQPMLCPMHLACGVGPRKVGNQAGGEHGAAWAGDKVSSHPVRPGLRGLSAPQSLGPTPGHYDSPKNSHIPGHYDLPPVRHPPSPPLQHRDP
ncbi:hypothetical protein QTO34_011383 [Cnephaeus nilssonii]|uniref:Platelet endothelial aggregation receptor 1 n=1 Tax=Cnephaeus nilssonii TaxID=3371016 RepID=A0AA40LF16_CNENI|nr:hypothetical protein QTO34_011383 [Eptesicus nilssonii]